MPGFREERGNPVAPMRREKSKWKTHEGESTDAGHRCRAVHSSGEGFVMEFERRDCTIQPEEGINRKREESRTKARPFCISQREVVEAFKQVKANQGAAGVDGQSITQFEANLRNNLYKIWNRMSSGSYFPPPVRRVEIPKGEGTRPLGIPTVADRIAQNRGETAHRAGVGEVLSSRLLTGIGREDRPRTHLGQQERGAGRTAGFLIWTSRPFFDSIDWALLLKAVRMHIDTPWVLLYIERWLKAPVRLDDGTLVIREKGTPARVGRQPDLGKSLSPSITPSTRG